MDGGTFFRAWPFSIYYNINILTEHLKMLRVINVIITSVRAKTEMTISKFFKHPDLSNNNKKNCFLCKDFHQIKYKN